MDGEESIELGLLWVDLTRLNSQYATSNLFSGNFSIKELQPHKLAKQGITQQPCDALVFEFDYPDRASLDVLRQTKHQFPHIPIIMVTEQHSESLAVWALHMRLWDYLVKPVLSRQVNEIRDQLLDLRAVKRQRNQRRPVHRDERLPTEYRIGKTVDATNILQRAIDYIDAHLAQRITLNEMADLCNMSSFRFSRTFKKVYGKNFVHHLTERRMTAAAAMLKNPSATIGDIAFMVGFKDSSHFAKTFRKYIGSSPAQYRRLVLGLDSEQPRQHSLTYSLDEV